MTNPQTEKQMSAKSAMDEFTTKRQARIVTPERARTAAQRLINSHFDSPNGGRTSIPVNLDDDDIVIHDFIDQAASRLPQTSTEKQMRAKELVAKVKAARDMWHDFYGVPVSAGHARFMEAIGELCDWAEAFAASRVPSAETASKWISVEEKLPEPGKRVLIWFREFGTSHSDCLEKIGAINNGHWRPEMGHGNFDDHVTHWQPLPDPPASPPATGEKK